MEKNPIIKSVCPWYRIGNKILIEHKSGITYEIEDNIDFSEYILRKMNGKNTISEIVKKTLEKFEKASGKDIEIFIKDLNDLGVVENKTTTKSILNDYEKERYSRNIGFLESYSSMDIDKEDLQKKITNAKVVLLGAGGVGSNVSLGLLSIGITDLKIVDYDKVELSNLNRQTLYNEDEIGKEKIYLAGERLKRYSNKAKIEVVSKQLLSVKEIEDVIAGADIVISAIDRPKTLVGLWLNQACVNLNIPFISGGVDRNRSITYTIIPGKTGCLNCWHKMHLKKNKDYELIRKRNEDYEKTGKRFGQDFSAFYPLVAMQTTFIVSEVVKRLTGIIEPLTEGKMMTIDFDDFQIKEEERWYKDDCCEVCKVLK